MYNQYLDDSDFVLLEPDPPSPAHRPQGQARHGPSRPNQPSPGQRRPVSQPGAAQKSKNDLVGEITGGLGQLLDGVLKHFSLKDFDTGDILLVLIILFLYLEGDNLELVITLGLLLLLGLGGDEAQE